MKNQALTCFVRIQSMRHFSPAKAVITKNSPNEILYENTSYFLLEVVSDAVMISELGSQIMYYSIIFDHSHISGLVKSHVHHVAKVTAFVQISISIIQIS